MTRLYSEPARALQDRFDTRRLADRIEERLLSDRIGDDDRALIERLDMFFLATVDAAGQPQCSYKGGEPGFVRVLDEWTLAFPLYDGNGMFLSAGNVLGGAEAGAGAGSGAGGGRVGLLFIDFRAERPTRIRVNGVASIYPGDPLAAEWPGAQLVVRVRVGEVFPNCPRYIHRLALVERSPFVPQADVAAPVPDWKRRPWAQDVLPAGDPAEGAEPL